MRGTLVALSHSIRLRPGAHMGPSVCSETLIGTEEGCEERGRPNIGGRGLQLVRADRKAVCGCEGRRLRWQGGLQ